MKHAKYIMRWAALPIGVLMFLLGAVTLPLPIPTGALLIALGLGIAAFNPLMLKWMRRIRGRFPRTNQKIRAVTPHMPGFMQRVLHRTDSRARK